MSGALTWQFYSRNCNCCKHPVCLDQKWHEERTWTCKLDNFSHACLLHLDIFGPLPVDEKYDTLLKLINACPCCRLFLGHVFVDFLGFLCPIVFPGAAGLAILSSNIAAPTSDFECNLVPCYDIKLLQVRRHNDNTEVD